MYSSANKEFIINNYTLDLIEQCLYKIEFELKDIPTTDEATKNSKIAILKAIGTANGILMTARSVEFDDDDDEDMDLLVSEDEGEMEALMNYIKAAGTAKEEKEPDDE